MEDILSKMKVMIEEKGGITKEDFDNLVLTNPPDDLQQEATFLHTFMCNKHHPEECDFYENDSWHSNAWREYLVAATTMRKEYEVDSLMPAAKTFIEIENLLLATGEIYRPLVAKFIKLFVI